MREITGVEMKPLIIGITGGTGSGKTTVAKRLPAGLKRKKQSLCTGFLLRDLSSYSEEEKFNFDHPSAFDNNLLIEHLNKLIRYEAIAMPQYSFQDYTRKKQSKRVNPAEVIILEGILILEDKTIRDLLDIKIYVDTDSDERFIRSLMRDTRERGRTLSSVVEQYLKKLSQCFAVCGTFQKYADIIIAGRIKQGCHRHHNYQYKRPAQAVHIIAITIHLQYRLLVIT